MLIDNDINGMRENYEKGELNIASVYPEPHRQFESWFYEARQNKNISEANAMVLSTATKDGQPSSRVVLLKDFKEYGFIFFTNYNSRKGKEIEINPKACINFWWSALERQIRIEGGIEKIPEKESDDYFYSRPPGSQAGAVTSPQSEIIENREWLEQEFHNIQLQGKTKRPDHWGGYILHPSKFEFWQGRSNRLHDRLLYTRKEEKGWEIKRLAP